MRKREKHITKWPAKVNREHTQHFKMAEIKYVEGTRLIDMEEQAFMSYFGQELAIIGGIDDGITVYYTSSRKIAMCYQGSGTFTESALPVDLDDWYAWVGQQAAAGNITVKGA